MDFSREFGGRNRLEFAGHHRLGQRVRAVASLVSGGQHESVAKHRRRQRLNLRVRRASRQRLLPIWPGCSPVRRATGRVFRKRRPAGLPKGGLCCHIPDRADDVGAAASFLTQRQGMNHDVLQEL